MKKVLLLISFAVMVISSATLSAQDEKYGPNGAECLKYIDYFERYFKNKEYDAALPNWRKAYELCPVTSRYSILQNGATLIKRLIKQNELNPTYKAQLIDSLMVIYEQRIEHWPKYKTNTLNYYATDMYNYLQDKQELYKGFNSVIDQLGSKTDIKNFPLYMKVACDLYKEGNLDPEQVIAAYEKSIKFLSEIEVPAGDSVKPKLIEKTISDIESLFIGSQVASCENLIALFTPRFEAEPENVELAKTIAGMMANTADCIDNDLFINAMTVWYNNEPSANAAYKLYRLNSSRGDVEKAFKFLEEAINSEDSDPDTDANYYYELAVYAYKNSDNNKAYEAANKAIEISDAVDGKAYMLIGTLWSNAVMSGDEVYVLSKYWVATDYMEKAKAADASLTEECNTHINTYKKYYPTFHTVFMFNLNDGDVYPETVRSGNMSAKTKIRSQK